MAIPTRYTNSTRSVEPWTTTPVSGSTFSRSIRYLGLGTEAPEIQVFVAFLAHSGAPNVGDGTEMRDNYRVYAEKMKERRAGPWIGDRCGASSLSCCGSCGAARLPVADGGADLELHKDDQKLIVQAKHWKTWLVKLPQVRELWGAVAAEHADGAIMVTSGSFTEQARRWTEGKSLTLVDGQELAKVITSIQHERESPLVTTTAEIRPCLSCGRPMVKRIAKNGALAGQTFWGCTGYPRCRHTEPLSREAVSR